MIRKIHAQKLIRNGILLEEEKIKELKQTIKERIDHYGKVTLGIIGSPGSGKSVLTKRIGEKGFLGIQVDKILLIDDLKDLAGKRYTKRELKKVVDELSDKVLVLVDYRSAVYLKSIDFIIVLMVDEKKRLENLAVRSQRSLKKYKRARYSVPPICMCYKSVFIVRSTDLDTLTS